MPRKFGFESRTTDDGIARFCRTVENGDGENCWYLSGDCPLHKREEGFNA